VSEWSSRQTVQFEIAAAPREPPLVKLAHEFVGQYFFKIVALFIHQLDKTSSYDSKQQLAV
jgi:hypothetical protein